MEGIIKEKPSTACPAKQIQIPTQPSHKYGNLTGKKELLDYMATTQ